MPKRLARPGHWLSTGPSPDQVRAEQLMRSELVGRIALAFVVVGLFVVLARVVQLQTWPGTALAQHIDHGTSRRGELARRGDLLDRRGRVLAASAVGHRLFVDPAACEDLDTIAVDLGALVGIDPVEIDIVIHQRLDRAPTTRFVVVREDLDAWQADAVRASSLAGVGVQSKLVRQYPAGDRAAGFVGMVGFEHSGLSGAEQRFDARLASSSGHLAYRRDRDLRPLWIEPDDYVPGTDGAPVRTSIDLVIQSFAEQRLDDAVTFHGARGGRLIAIDPWTGELIAMYDTLNPNFTRDTIDDRATAFGPRPLRPNRCVTDPYEPGSTFKPFVWASATQMGRAHPDEMLPTPEGWGWKTPYGRVIQDSWYYGKSSWRKVLVKSMNTGMAMIAERLTHEEMQQILMRFGFGQRTHAGIPGETPGQLTPPAKWTKYTQSSVAMGHEISVSTLQMVRAFSAFARDGSLPTLRLTAASHGDERFRLESRAITPEIAQQTRLIMADVMTEGTGRDANSEKYRLFGKSGTAELWDSRINAYHRDRYTASFIAGAPLEAPRLVVLCVLDDPDKDLAEHGGGHSAGPVVRDVMDFALSYLGVPGDQIDESTATDNQVLSGGVAARH